MRLERIELEGDNAPLLYVSGVDFVDQTPIYDIKPYLPYTDSYPQASAGFAEEVYDDSLIVEIPEQWLQCIPVSQRQAVKDLLAQDPRPHYQQEAQRIYGVAYAGMDIRFTVDKQVLRVCEIAEYSKVRQKYEVKYLKKQD